MDLKYKLFKLFLPKTAQKYEFAIVHAGVLTETFIRQEYRWLLDDIKPNTTVIDIGANIGDTAIYFAYNNNVKKVYAYEPYFNNYRLAKENIKLSKLENKIDLIHGGYLIEMQL